MKQEPHKDLIIIGGGVNGAAIARDASLRGLSVLLLEANDFGCGASGNNGRMIHGGLRYLETGQIGLVRDALRERATLLKVAPHIVKAQTLLIPSYKNSGRPGWMVRMGLLVLDVLAFGVAPMHRRLSRKVTLSRVGSLRSNNLSGAYIMHDAFAENSERLTIENIIDAAALNADIRNRCRVRDVSRNPSNSLSVRWSGPQGDDVCSAPVVVNATGAWADDFLSGGTVANSQMVTKAAGSFLVMRSFEGGPKEAVFFEAKSDGRPIIIVPWHGNYLIGTTDREIEGPVAEVQAKADDIDYLFDALSNTFDASRFDRSDILFTYSGVRPLPRKSGASHKISRDHVIHHHEAPLNGMVTVLGGKLSTFRSLAEEVTDSVYDLLGKKSPTSVTARRPLPGAKHSGKAAKEELADSELSERTQERLLDLYGGRSKQILQLTIKAQDLAEVIDETSGAIAAEFVFAVESEFAQSLADILLRRTLLGYRTGRGRDLIDHFRWIARQHLEWSSARIENDIEEYKAQLAATDGTMFHTTDHRVAADERVI